MCSQCIPCRNRDSKDGTLILKKSRPLKILLVGDRGCGKTKLVRKYTQNIFTEEQEEGDLADLQPSTFEHEGNKVAVVIYDPPAGDDCGISYKSWYCNADVIILCFDVCNKFTLESVKKKWIPELESAGCAESYHFLLVGTKMDDRDRHIKRCSRIGKTGNTVSKVEGQSMQKDIRSCAYLECSARTGEGVNNVFRVASLFAYERSQLKRSWFAKFEKWNIVKNKNSMSKTTTTTL